jgi:hypothetical protein
MSFYHIEDNEATIDQGDLAVPEGRDIYIYIYRHAQPIETSEPIYGRERATSRSAGALGSVGLARCYKYFAARRLGQRLNEVS